MAPAQPPRVYAGFSSTDVTQGGAEYRPHHTRSARYGDTTGEAGKGGYAAKDPPSVSGVGVHQYSRSKYTSGNPAKVRKVHRLVSEDSKDDIITPSSWRVGKELAERILKAQQQAEVLLSDSTLDRSSSHLSFHDSLDQSSHASTPSHAHRSFSDTSLHIGVPGEPEKPQVPLPPDYRGAGKGFDKGSEFVSSHGPIPPRATQVSSDVDRLLEELRASSRKREVDVRPAGDERGGSAAGFRGKDTASTSEKTTTTTKTKYSYGK